MTRKADGHKKGSIFLDPDVNKETMYAEIDGTIYEFALQRNKGREWWLILNRVAPRTHVKRI